MSKKERILTKEGLEKLKKEYDELVNKKRPEVIDTIQKTRAMGDLSENGGYQAAKEQQSFIEGRIEELEEIFKNAKVVEEKNKKDTISVGSKVTLENVDTSEKVTYGLVGATESDPAELKISYESPLGESLLNKKVGDTVTIQAPAGEIKYKVLEVK